MRTRLKKLGLFVTKRSLLNAIFLFFCISINAQVTTKYNGVNKIKSKNETAALYSVSIYPNITEVTIELIPTKNRKRMNYWTSINTVIIADGLELPIVGFLGYNNGEKVVNTAQFSGNWGWNNVKAGQKYYYTMVFNGTIPPGVTTFSIVDRGVPQLTLSGTYTNSHGYGFSNYKLNNPSQGATSWTETSIRQNADENNDGICGIYETTQGAGYKLGCVKENGEYTLIYLGSSTKMSWWQAGDIKATLRNSATAGFYKAEWLMANKTLNNDCYVVFDGGSMKTSVKTDTGTEESFYLKMYPASSNTGLSSQTGTWSGTGFALNNGYIATNNHVVENAKSIKVKGIGGNFNVEYDATVVAKDIHNDLAIIKINDNSFMGFGAVPYQVKTTTAEVGQDVFVLGYPLTTTMGDEIKLTTGVISAKTGFQGDVSLYQISAPVQPGNSGGPLFDSKGDVIGIVNAKHTGAENVGYAIKTSYLQNLMATSLSSNTLPTSNTISALSLSEKVKRLKNFTFMITCSSQASNSSSTFSNSNTTSGTNERTINNPSVAQNYNAESTKINKVIINSSYTAVQFTYKNHYAVGGWCAIDKNTYILVDGQRYTMTRAEGINISPSRTTFSREGEELTFTLYFPAIPSNATRMDLIESLTSVWRFYGISLN